MKQYRKMVVAAGVFWCLLSAMGIHSQAYTKPVVTKSGIEYPISLSTGKDAAGKVVFSDDNFADYIRQETFQTGNYEGYEFDLDGDGFLSKEECEMVRVLSVSGRKDIKSVTGIEAFPKLRELYCSGTGIDKLDLENNPRLQIVSCSNTDITELDVSGCPMLKKLMAGNCQLAGLNLENNSELEFLTCQEQKRNAFTYQEGEKYLVNLADLDKNIQLSNVSDVKIDGAEGDGVNSGYDDVNGIVFCSDQMKTISYTYDLGLKTVDEDSMDASLTVTLSLSDAIREKYDTRGGSNILAQYIPNGSVDTEPENPKRDGYRFTGWYRSEECDEKEKWKFGSALTGNLVLYAGWEKKEYLVKYDAAGGSMPVKERTVDWWSASLIPTGEAVPVRPGYELAGWQTETGILITKENSGSVTYGQASGKSDWTGTLLTAKWKEKTGYQLRYLTALPNNLSKKVQDMPEKLLLSNLPWEYDGGELIDSEPLLAGYDFIGWYTARTGGNKFTSDMKYKDIYASQYTGDSVKNIPALYARFQKKKITIYYDEKGGSKVADRTGVEWGSKNLLPKKKTKKKNHVFVGWKCNGVKVTKKTKLDSISSGYEDFVVLTAVWHKKYEKKGKIFQRYGCRYQVIRSNKKGNKVKLIGITKKKITIRYKIFYNGKFFKLTQIKKKALRQAKKVLVKVPAKKNKKFRKMLRKAGARARIIKTV